MATQIPTKVEINCETGEVTETPLTAEEIAERDARAAEYEQKRAEILAAEEAKAEAKASALIKLAALGLTEEEAQAIAN